MPDKEKQLNIESKPIVSDNKETEKAEIFEIKEDFESKPENVEKELSRKKKAKPTTHATQEPPKASSSKVKSHKMAEIENILEDNLRDVFLQMNEEQKKEFKKEGERVAYKIDYLLKGVKSKTREILKLIRNWLKLIPGVSKFFLEQEAKIKADKILAMKNIKEEK